MLDLKITPRTVKEVEDLTHKSILQLFGSENGFSVTVCVAFIQRSFGINESLAYEKLSAYLNEKPENDIIALSMEIMEGLQKGGFLPRNINLQEAKEKLQESTQAANPEVTPETPIDSATNG